MYVASSVLSPNAAEEAIAPGTIDPSGRRRYTYRSKSTRASPQVTLTVKLPAWVPSGIVKSNAS